MKVLLGPDQGIIQLARNDRPAGEPVDLYAEKRRKSGLIPLGELDLPGGENEIVLRLPGMNAKSSGLGLDLAELILEKIF